MRKILKIIKNVIKIALIQDGAKLMESHLNDFDVKEQHGQEKKEEYRTAYCQRDKLIAINQCN